MRQKPRHPEKVNNKETSILPKPKWIRSRLPSSKTFETTKDIIKAGNVVLTEDDMPDCELPRSNDPNCAVTMLDNGQGALIAIKNIDILGLCSSYGESFPNVLAEAMISGVPCISTQIGVANNILSNYGKIVSLKRLNALI